MLRERNSCLCDNEVGEIREVSQEEVESDRKEYYKILEGNHLSRFEHTKEEIMLNEHNSFHINPYEDEFFIDEQMSPSMIECYKRLNARGRDMYNQAKLRCKFCRE